MSHTPAAWQLEPCPSWCTRAHDDADLPDDHAHTSEALPVPVITREFARTDGGALYEVYAAATILLALSRRTGEHLTWLNLTDEERNGFEITLDGAELLSRGLTAMLDRTHAG